MSYRVAVASSDNKFVNQHFGHAEWFLIFEIDGDVYRLLETRSTAPLCDDQEHNDDRLNSITKLIADCRAVLVAKIGPGALQQLRAEGIQAYESPNFIDEALQALIADDRIQTPPASPSKG